MNLGKLIDRLHQEDPNREIPIELIIIPCPKDRYYNSLSHCEANEGE